MALETENKLYIALAVLAALGGAVYFQNKKQKDEAASYSAEGRAKDLPKIEISEDQTKGVDRIVITQPPGDAGAPTEVVLEKKGDDWRLVKPVAASANQSNVKSLLDNLKTLKIAEEIAPGKDAYEKFGVSDGKALHAVFSKGSDAVGDFYFGEGGSRGQMTRIAGRDGVYAVKGYSSFLYQRDMKGWRDLTILKFDDAKAKSVDITNENGHFLFEKTGDAWAGTFTEAKKGSTAKKIEKLDDSKVKDLLRAYKALNADGFADSKTDKDTGLDAPKATLVVKMDDGATYEIKLGGAAESSSKWAKKTGMPESFSLSSWAADWATAALAKFVKPDDKKDDKKKDEPAAPPGGFKMPEMPPGMGGGME